MSPTPPGTEREQPAGEEESCDMMSLDTPDFVINAGSSSDDDDDEEEFNYQGYQLLPQDPAVQFSTQDEVAATSDTLPAAEVSHDVDTTVRQTLDAETLMAAGRGQSLFDLPPVENTEQRERRELWSGSRSDNTATVADMPEAHAAKIKAALADFSLPASHTPDWAKFVAEDDWKTQLMSRLKPSQRGGKSREVTKDSLSSDGSSTETVNKS